MSEFHLLSYLVLPSKGEASPTPPSGAHISVGSKLEYMMLSLFDKSEKNCNIEIAFSPNANEEQQNNTQDLIIDFCKFPSLTSGEIIATKLSQSTPKQSGPSLLFLILKKTDTNRIKLLLSRFPATQGILAESANEVLKLDLVEQVFQQSHNRYKAAYYQGIPISKGLWYGRAIDKQINYGQEELAKYWIYHFLESTYKDPSARGTIRLVDAIKNGIANCSDINVKTELTSVAHLIKGLNGKSTSIKSALQTFHLSEEAISVVASSLKNPQSMDTEFKFDAEEAIKRIPYRSIELDNSAIMTAPSEKFDKVFKSNEQHSNDNSTVTYTTTGRIVKTQYRRRK